MLIHRWDAARDEAEWRGFVHAQGFGHLIAAGSEREYPVVVPTQIRPRGRRGCRHDPHASRPPEPDLGGARREPSRRHERGGRLGVHPGLLESRRRRGSRLWHPDDVLRRRAAVRDRRRRERSRGDRRHPPAAAGLASDRRRPGRPDRARHQAPRRSEGCASPSPRSEPSSNTAATSMPSTASQWPSGSSSAAVPAIVPPSTT